MNNVPSVETVGVGPATLTATGLRMLWSEIKLLIVRTLPSKTRPDVWV